jgi:small subunit ribosomal protein S12
MATINQLIKRKKVVKRAKVTVKALQGCPYKRGTCVRVLTTKPKKPNSAIRKIVKVKLTNGRRITAVVPGIGHKLYEHAVVLVRGGRANDLPGVRYKLVRGVYDFDKAEDFKRTHKRSKYGVKKKEK